MLFMPDPNLLKLLWCGPRRTHSRTRPLHLLRSAKSCNLYVDTFAASAAMLHITYLSAYMTNSLVLRCRQMRKAQLPQLADRKMDRFVNQLVVNIKNGIAHVESASHKAQIFWCRSTWSYIFAQHGYGKLCD